MDSFGNVVRGACRRDDGIGADEEPGVRLQAEGVGEARLGVVKIMFHLPQALILSAIVISFSVLAFTLAMACRADKSTGTDDVDDLRSADAQ